MQRKEGLPNSGRPSFFAINSEWAASSLETPVKSDGNPDVVLAPALGHRDDISARIQCRAGSHGLSVGWAIRKTVPYEINLNEAQRNVLRGIQIDPSTEPVG